MGLGGAKTGLFDTDERLQDDIGNAPTIGCNSRIILRDM